VKETVSDEVRDVQLGLGVYSIEKVQRSEE